MTTVAIIDDDDGVRAALEDLMRSQQYEVSTYTSVDQFLTSRPTSRPAIIITDIEMPGLKGSDLIDILAREGITVPVIVITGRLDFQLNEGCARVCSILTKPFDSSDLCEAVAKNVRDSVGE